jgi:hypothetical protein
MDRPICPICDDDTDNIRVMHPGDRETMPFYVGTWCACGCIFNEVDKTVYVIGDALTDAQIQLIKDKRKENLLK